MSERATLDAFNSVPAPPGGTAGRRRLREFDPEPWLESAATLLSEPDPGPTPFLVEGLIVDGAIAAIQGPPKVGKTWLVLELAIAIVTGREAFGCVAVPDPGPVVLVLEESGRAALHRRLGALARGRATDSGELAALHFAANRRVRLNDPDWRAKLLAAGKAIRPRAIVLDPLARVKGAGVDENAQKEIGPVLDFMRELRDETGAAIVFVHHTPHDTGRLRGSSDIEATWESKLAVTRDENGVRSIAAEHREAESGGTLRYRLTFDEPTESVRLDPVAETARPGRNFADEIENFLRDHPGAIADEIASAPDIRKRPRFVREILESDPRFVEVPPEPKRKSNARCWALSELPVPGDGTGRDGVSRGQPTSCPSRGLHNPVGVGVPYGFTSPGRDCPSPLPVPGDEGFPDFVRRRYRAGHLTREEWLARVRLHRLSAPSVQGTLDAGLEVEVEQLVAEGVLVREPGDERP